MEPSGRSHQRGPLTFTHSGKGARPWLPGVDAAPGWVYLVSPPVSTVQRRVCWRCVVSLNDEHEGRASIRWEDAPPAPGDRCARCERGYGERFNRFG